MQQQLRRMEDKFEQLLRSQDSGGSTSSSSGLGKLKPKLSDMPSPPIADDLQEETEEAGKQR